MNDNNARRLLVGCEIAIVLFFAAVITSAARWAFGEGRGQQIRTGMSPLADKLLTDGAQASLVADWIISLKPDIDRPLAWQISISTARWTRNYGVNPRTVVAMMYKESGFNPSARSRTNDHGLLQLHGRPIYGVDENIRAGVIHFAGCLAAAGGDEAKGLSRYCGGSSRYAHQVLKIKEGLR